MQYRIGTRESKLALIQTELVCKALIDSNPHLSRDQFELIKIRTIGDRTLNKNLVDIGGKNLFIKEIDDELLAGKVDFAVHSLKDMTAKLDPNLVIAACLEREDPRDAFLSTTYKDLADLPKGALIGTSSIRRKFLALHYRPDLMTVAFRGNVVTRLEKLKQKKVDATFLAVAGLKRLDIDQKSYVPLDVAEFLPAVSQGVIGVECRKDDQKTYQLLRSINHLETEICNQAERGFLECVEANCNSPIAAYATLNGEQINIDGLVIDSNGKIHRYKLKGPAQEAWKLGYEVGLKLRVFL